MPAAKMHLPMQVPNALALCRAIMRTGLYLPGITQALPDVRLMQKYYRVTKAVAFR
jgi:hypothetical protein